MLEQHQITKDQSGLVDSDRNYKRKTLKILRNKSNIIVNEEVRQAVNREAKNGFTLVSLDRNKEAFILEFAKSI
jgi:hypothetical protein